MTKLGRKAAILGASIIGLALFNQAHSFSPPTNKQAKQGKIGMLSKQDEKAPAVAAESQTVQIKTYNPLKLLVLRLGLTELAGTSMLNYGKYDGTFKCAYCGHELFDSNSKYNSGSGWPSFWSTKAEGSLEYKREMSGSLECRCSRCSSHLGHVFLDGPRPETVAPDVLEKSPDSDPRSTTGVRLPRFCINGAALSFVKRV